MNERNKIVPIRYSPSEGLTDPSRPNVREEDHSAPATPTLKQGGGVVRLVVDSEGQMNVTQSSGPSKMESANEAPKTAMARNATGPIPLALADENAIISLPGMGESNAATYERMGLIRRLPSGKGYEVIGMTAPELEAAKKDAPKPDEPPTVNPNDVRGVPGVTAEGDAFQASLEQHVPMAFNNIITSIARGVEPDYTDAARQMKVEPEVFKAQVDGLRSQYIASGQAALRNVGVDNPEAFESWARVNHPDDADSAVRDMVTGKSVARLQQLGRKFVQYSNDRLATILERNGVKTWTDHGTLFVTLPGGKNKTFRDAVKDGDIEVV